jgi:hypothetical protein
MQNLITLKLIEMKKISLWGKNNPWKARIIIAVSHLLLTGMAIGLGIQSYLDDVRVSREMIEAFIIIFILAYFLYPIRGMKKGIFTHTYIRQKKHDFILAFSTFLFIGGATNQYAYEPLAVSDAQLHVVPVVYRLKEQQKAPSSIAAKKDFRMALKSYVKDIKLQVKEMKRKKNNGLSLPEGNYSKGGLVAAKVLLFLLTLSLAFFLFVGVASLACTLSCNGQEGAAVLVFIGGLSLIIFLMIISIRGIVRMGKPKKDRIIPSPEPVIPEVNG